MSSSDPVVVVTERAPIGICTPVSVHCGGTGRENFWHPLTVLEEAGTSLAGTGHTARRSTVPLHYNIVADSGQIIGAFLAADELLLESWKIAINHNNLQGRFPETGVINIKRRRQCA